MTALPVEPTWSHTKHGFTHRFLREISVAVAYLILLLILFIVRPDFFHVQFFLTWVTAAPVLVAAVGMSMVIIAREIDISIGSMFSVCGVCAALMAKMGWPMPVVAMVTLLLGAAFGAANGLLVAFLGLPSIVVTLATMVIMRQSLIWMRQGQSVHDTPADFQWLGHTQHFGQWMLLISAAVILLAFHWGLKHLYAGRAIYAVGSDREAARLVGIRPKLTIFSVFMLMGALSGLAALLNSIRQPVVSPDAGFGLELQVIAAVVVGGIAITGGRGNLIGTLLGVILLIQIDPELKWLGRDPAWQKAIQGAIILIAVSTDALQRGNK
jgi:rhamnose transport system permease protein